MSCKYVGVATQYPQVTVMSFFVDPDGEDTAFVNQSGPKYSKNFASYSFDGKVLKVGFPLDFTYNFSLGDNIVVRTFEDCVTSAYGGETKCEKVTETCLLQ